MIEKFIESEANAKFKRWKKLARDARAVRKERATLMEGIHLMQVALESGCRVNAVLIDADRASREARELALELCRKSGADLFALSPALYDQLSPVEHGVGVMCEAAVPPAPADDAWKSADALYLDGVQDAGNAGTLIRTAVAAGVRVVAASPVAATLWSPKVMRAGMGAHFGAVFIENITPEAFRRAYRGRIYAADARGGEDLFLAADDVAEGPVCWLMGAECFIMGMILPTTAVNADGVEYTKAWVLNFDKVREASWFALPKVMPVKPIFDMRAIVPVLIMFIVTAVETIGDISGVMEGGLGREATDKELSGGVMCDGLGSSLAALFGVLPNTSFSQNVGLVTMTKVVNRMALACGAGVLILCGLFPKLAALISIMPQSVLGGAAVMMFSSIVVSGIQLITKEKLTGRNITIVSVALGLGYGLGANSDILRMLPDTMQLIFGGSGIVPAAIVALVLNIVLPKDEA